MRTRLTVLIFFCIHVLVAQQEPKPLPAADKKYEGSIWDRMFVGGNLGIQFGSVTIVDISPAVGYKFTEKLMAGVGVTYLYYSDQYYNFSTSVYGGRIFSRYMVLDNIFLHGEYEMLDIERKDFVGSRTTVSNLLGGLGYRQQVSDFGYMSMIVLWNFTDSYYSPYSNPIIRIGYGVGF